MQEDIDQLQIWVKNCKMLHFERSNVRECIHFMAGLVTAQKYRGILGTMSIAL